MAEACVALARLKKPSGKSLEKLVCCLARDGVDASVLINFVGDSLVLSRFLKLPSGRYGRTSDLNWDWKGGGAFAKAISAARDRFGSDDASRLDAVLGRLMHAAKESEEEALAAWLILGGFTKVPGTSAAQIVAPRAMSSCSHSR